MKVKVGQTVYIQGLYRAKVLKIYSPTSVTCKVYEGLPGYDEHRGIYTYSSDLLETNRRKKYANRTTK